MEELNRTVEALEERRRTCQFLYVAYGSFYVAALILLFFSREAGVAMGLANVLFYFFVVRRSTKGYREEVGRAAVRFGTCREMSQPEWLEPTDAEALAAPGLLPPPTGGTLCRHRWRAEKGSVTIDCAEITFHYETKAGGKRDFKYLSGTLLTAAPVGAWEGEYLFLRGGLLTEQAGKALTEAEGYVRSDPPGGRWAEGWELWERGSPRRLPGRVWKLIENLPSLGALRISPQGTAAFLPIRFYFPQKVLLRTDLTPERFVTDPLPEAGTLAGLAEELGKP